ncbi:hypothetical protein HMPREF8577_0166 [Streptococcus parasanguinis ATCC 903]|uniref:DUF2207 domain-containing protein n=1 Tax=Streptococcus parasanguinis TaxID=1318 RepID=A0AAX4AWQ9_STRPA|nr:DUF2207 domain-containing protein [Streptococcus parasanguinis]EFX39590.1 hypothetical protein HMPREF8577_0166 [Streptococcus parasanguinis ATCC 903]WNB83058.1 DUF2207 domain-containing protein [Streptococcus parasanguinis]
MKRFLLMISLIWSLVCTITIAHADDEVRYSIESYVGHLQLQEDSQATFTQEITYQFQTGYHGQYVTLGSADPLPKGFKIHRNPEVEAYVDGEKREIRVEETDLEDGRQLKIYNARIVGGTVKIKVKWKIDHLLTFYKDIAELNWFPISDGDEKVAKLDFYVDGLDAKQGKLYAHTGYFNPPAQVERTATGYHIWTKDFPKNGKLELHGYWPMTEALRRDQANEINQGNGKEKFLKKEKSIEQKTFFYRTLLLKVVPIVSVLLFILAFIPWIRYFISTRTRRISKGVRLYEPPQNLPPLVLAKALYQLDFERMVMSREKGQLKFNHLIQATMLDLIDRGNLRLTRDENGETLTCLHYEGLADFELKFIEMIFDQESAINISEVFSKYKIDKVALKKDFRAAKSDTQRDRIRKIGNEVQSLLKKDAQQLSKGVDKEIAKLGLPSYFRDLSEKEEALSKTGCALHFWLLLILFVSMCFLSFGFGSHLSSFYFWMIVLLVVFFIPFYILVKIREDHLQSLENLDSQFQWMAFRNMIESIPNFNQAELESVILWNRILVYATMYGQAKKVSQVLKNHQISLPYENWDAVVWITTSSNSFLDGSTLMSYADDSYSVSSFSTNSSDGSGGFDGGGFSDGGGGGGFGAF